MRYLVHDLAPSASRLALQNNGTYTELYEKSSLPPTSIQLHESENSLHRVIAILISWRSVWRTCYLRRGRCWRGRTLRHS